MRVEVVLAWPERHRAVMLDLPDDATVNEAVAAAALDVEGVAVATAIHGVLVDGAQRLRDGDRIELLRPLLVDPKDARRRRARTP